MSDSVISIEGPDHIEEEGARTFELMHQIRDANLTSLKQLPEILKCENTDLKGQEEELDQAELNNCAFLPSDKTLGSRVLAGDVYLKELNQFMSQTKKGDSAEFLIQSQFKDDRKFAKRKKFLSRLLMTLEKAVLFGITISPLFMTTFSKEVVTSLVSLFLSLVLLCKVRHFIRILLKITQTR